jgi:molecular chaperone DnaJ
MSLEIDFMDAINGTTKSLNFSRVDVCGVCKGSKAKPGTTASTCGGCGGTGFQ